MTFTKEDVTPNTDWVDVSWHPNLSESFIREFADKLNWRAISVRQALSESFIREFADRVDWTCVSQCQFLSEEFMREFQYNLNWFAIPACQKLSEDFVWEFKDTLDLQTAICYQELSKDFILKLTRSGSPVAEKLGYALNVPINLELLETLKACQSGIKSFLEHTQPDETIDWFTLKERHPVAKDLHWLTLQLLKHGIK